MTLETTSTTASPPRPAAETSRSYARPFQHKSMSDADIWACIRRAESGDNYRENSGNGYTGAYQDLPRTWNVSVTGAGYPQYANGRADLAPPAVQDAAAIWLQAHSGWGQWSTARMCGAFS